jgi:hypothetical protein
MSNANVLPKSLHTVTVLMQIARARAQQTGCQPHEAVQYALKLLFGALLPSDPYGLAVTAARKLAAEARREAP